MTHYFKTVDDIEDKAVRIPSLSAPVDSAYGLTNSQIDRLAERCWQEYVHSGAEAGEYRGSWDRLPGLTKNMWRRVVVLSRKGALFPHWREPGIDADELEDARVRRIAEDGVDQAAILLGSPLCWQDLDAVQQAAAVRFVRGAMNPGG